jgi:hypothetical protein
MKPAVTWIDWTEDNDVLAKYKLKSDCLFCHRPALLAARAVRGSHMATIRCCLEQSCKDKAEQIALAVVHPGSWNDKSN